MDPNSTRMFCILRGNAVAVAGGQQQRSVCCGHNSCCSSPHHQHSRPLAQVTTSCCKTAKAKRGGNQEEEIWAIIVKNKTNDDAGEFLPSLERPPRHVLLICRETLSQVHTSSHYFLRYINGLNKTSQNKEGAFKTFTVSGPPEHWSIFYFSPPFVCPSVTGETS